MGLGGDLGWVLWPTLGNHVMSLLLGTCLGWGGIRALRKDIV